MAEFDYSNVIIVNEVSFRAKLAKIVKDGISNFHVITDFDRTLSEPEKIETKSEDDDEESFSTLAVVLNSKYVSDKFRTTTMRLYNKYYPIEMSHELTIEQKIPHMLTWYKTAHEALLEEQITKQQLEETVVTSSFALRSGALEFLNLIINNSIPCLVFSAGFATVIDLLLRLKYKLSLPEDTFHLIGNRLLFNEEGEHKGFSKLVHMFNKNETQTKGHSYETQIAERKNVLLLGDGFGDVHMADGMSHETVVKVGFLNHNVKNLLCQYKEIYDVVIVGERSDFSFITNEVLLKVLKS